MRLRFELKCYTTRAGNPGTVGSWGIPSIFGNTEKSANGNSKEQLIDRGHSEPVQGSMESTGAIIQLREVWL